MQVYMKEEEKRWVIVRLCMYFINDSYINNVSNTVIY